MMNERTHALAQGVAGIGPRWDAVALVLQPAPMHWRLYLHDGTVLVVTHEPARGCVALCTRLLPGAPEHRLAVYAALLRAHALALRGDGLRLGLADDGQIELALEVGDTLDPGSDLPVLLEHLHATRLAWSAFVAQPAGEHPALLPWWAVKA